MAQPDFSALHPAMRAQVDQQFLPGLSTALLRGREVVDRICYGHADREAGLELREDHIFRMLSSAELQGGGRWQLVGWAALRPRHRRDAGRALLRAGGIPRGMQGYIVDC